MKKQSSLSEEQIDRIIEMAWEDRTPFDAILIQFGLKEKAVIKLMRNEMKYISNAFLHIHHGSRKTIRSYKSMMYSSKEKMPEAL